ncbi:MAG: SPFH domain-containing protein [Planctomycetia bacterium]|jgi:regulator of protease activity HflC (stomatin/prohibitin superfamily)
MELRNPSVERPFAPLPGAAMLVAEVLLAAAVVALLVAGARSDDPRLAVAALPLAVLFFVLMGGFFVVEPNLGRVLVLFGDYRGTVREPGFHWTNPFTSKKKVSLRAHNLDGKTLKVNDLLGNPIEIAAIVVWQVRDTARATFDVENHEHFVGTQAESALRMVASRHPYDDGQTSEVQTTLRGSADDVARELAEELRTRLELAGIEVVEARLSHLAYSAEIAAAMLQRQQAGAIVAARQLIVEGAVGMVEQALHRLDEKGMVQLDPERRAAMVGNLLVVLCGQANATPVVNAGTLYN